MIDEYAPGFSSSIIGYDMLTPPDLEREIGLTGAQVLSLLISYTFSTPLPWRKNHSYMGCLHLFIFLDK